MKYMRLLIPSFLKYLICSLGISFLSMLCIGGYTLSTFLISIPIPIIVIAIHMYLTKTVEYDKHIKNLKLDKDRIKTMIEYADNHNKISRFIYNQKLLNNKNRSIPLENLFFSAFNHSMDDLNKQKDCSLYYFMEIATGYLKTSDLEFFLLYYFQKINSDDLDKLNKLDRTFNIYQEDTVNDLLDILNDRTMVNRKFTRQKELRKLNAMGVFKVEESRLELNLDYEDEEFNNYHYLDDIKKVLTKAKHLKSKISKLDVNLSHKYLLSNLYDAWLLMTLLCIADNQFEVTKELKDSLDKMYSMAEAEEAKEQDIENKLKEDEISQKHEFWNGQSKEFLDMINSIHDDFK